VESLETAGAAGRRPIGRAPGSTWFGVGRLVASVGGRRGRVRRCVLAGSHTATGDRGIARDASRPRPSPTRHGGPSTTTTPGACSESPVLVHVAGSVVEPGVYELAPGAPACAMPWSPPVGRPPDADWNALNLAAVVVDGSRVYVPAVGEEVVARPGRCRSRCGAGGRSDRCQRATAEQLETLPGVGPATATAIVTERERNGPFVDVDDLDRVPGIGPAKLDGLRDLVTT
jgi:competence protein ComEA